MDFRSRLDEITKKSADFIDKSVKGIEETSKDVLDSTRASVDKFKIENEIKDKKTLLGQTVYEFWLNDTYGVEESDSICIEIKELEEKLKKIDNIKKA